MNQQLFEILLKSEKQQSFTKGVLTGLLIAFVAVFTLYLLGYTNNLL